MCYLCRKVELLHGVDSKSTKPILIVLSKLHRLVEPSLGGLWLWRHEETTKLRGMLGSLHRIVPAKALEAIIAEVDQDLVHIKKNMADHPPRQNTGSENVSTASITADQSSSVRMSKERQQERERRQSDRKSRGLASSGRLLKSPAGNDLRDLPGSDVHPPSAEIGHANRLVENWMRKNDALVATYSRKDLNNESMVSVVGGGISQRPAIDVGVWKVSGVQNGDGKSTSKRQIPTAEAVELLHAKQRRKERTGLICGGTSGPSTKPSLMAVSKSSKGRTGLEHSLTHSVALNTSEAGECLEIARAKVKMSEFSSTTSSSLFSSQPPPLNLGSLVQHSPSAGEKRREQGLSHQEVQTSASSNSTRPSATNCSRIQNQPLSSKEQLLKKHQKSKHSTRTEATRMKISSHKPTVPVPIGRPLSTAGNQDTNQLRRTSRQVLAKSGASSAAVSRDSQTGASHSAKRVVAGTEEPLKDNTPTKSTYVRYFQSRKCDTSDAAQSAIKRRIERRKSMSDDEKLAQDRRKPSQPILTSRSKEAEVSEAVKRSRRRRAERDSMPCNDRYRSEERKKAWTSTRKEPSVRID